MKCPQYAKVGDRTYKIDTNFRTAIRCNDVATDVNIGDIERALAIIYLLFGKEGLDAEQDHDKLLEIAIKYLSCGKEVEPSKGEPDMDYTQDMDYIEASFMSDYNIDLTTQDMDWWKFNNLINGLSFSEMGSCCILNRIRYIRSYDLSKCSTQKEKQEMIKAKEQVALKNNKRVKKFTKEQEENIKKFYELIEGKD